MHHALKDIQSTEAIELSSRRKLKLVILETRTYLVVLLILE